MSHQFWLTQGRPKASNPSGWQRTLSCMTNCVTLAWKMGHLSSSVQSWQSKDKHEGLAELEWGMEMPEARPTHVPSLSFSFSVQRLPFPKTQLSLQKVNCSLSKSFRFLYNTASSCWPPWNLENWGAQKVEYGSEQFSRLSASLNPFGNKVGSE